MCVPDHLDDDDVRIALAAELYREGKVTLKQAADLARLCVEDFMRALSDRGVSVINWNEEELSRELSAVDSL